MTRKALFWAAWLVLTAGCEDPEEASAGAVASAGASGSGGAETTRPQTTYHQVIAPLLARHCRQCHSEGNIAPFQLSSYEEAAPMAGAMASAVRARRMPPYPADNTGSCNTFRDARWLSDEEIQAFEDWEAEGAPRGKEEATPEMVPPPALTGRLLSISMGEDYAPNVMAPDDYRCFIVDVPAAEEELFVTGFDAHPGEPRVVHHIIVYNPANDEAVAKAREMDEGEPGPGYTCFGTARVTAGAVAAWAPGGGATLFPANSGIKIKPSRPLILQVHYNTQAGPGLSDRTGVDLQVVTGGVKQARFAPLADLGLSLSPHQAEATAGATLPLFQFDHPVQVFGVFPHMHTLGRTLRIDVERPGAAPQCLIDVPRWDFHWQMLYFHHEPIVVSPGDLLSLRCTFDTRSRSEQVVWGEGTTDEMCVAGVYVVP